MTRPSKKAAVIPRLRRRPQWFSGFQHRDTWNLTGEALGGPRKRLKIMPEVSARFLLSIEDTQGLKQTILQNPASLCALSSGVTHRLEASSAARPRAAPWDCPWPQSSLNPGH